MKSCIVLCLVTCFIQVIELRTARNPILELIVTSQSQQIGDTVKTHFNITIPEIEEEPKDDPRPYRLYSTPPIITPQKPNKPVLEEPLKHTLIEKEKLGGMDLGIPSAKKTQAIPKKREGVKFWDTVEKMAAKTYNAIKSPFKRRLMDEESDSIEAYYDADVSYYDNRRSNAHQGQNKSYYDRSEVPHSVQSYYDADGSYHDNDSRRTNARKGQNKSYYYRREDADASNYDNVYHRSDARHNQKRQNHSYYYRSESPRTADSYYDADLSYYDNVYRRGDATHKKGPNSREVPQTVGSYYDADASYYDNVYRRSDVPKNKKQRITPAKVTFFGSGPYSGTYYDKPYRAEPRPTKDSFQDLDTYYRRNCNCAGRVATCKCAEDIQNKSF